jgi:hypothetical protein
MILTFSLFLKTSLGKPVFPFSALIRLCGADPSSLFGLQR